MKVAAGTSASSAPTLAFGALTVALTLCGWSSVPLFLRHFAESIDHWTSNGVRYGFSALLWLPVIVWGAARDSLPKGLWKAALIPSVVNAAGQVLFTAAHYQIDPALLTFGLRSQLIFVAIGAWMMFPRERAIIRTPGYLAGAGILIAGVVGVVALDVQPASVESMRGVTKASHAIGVLLAIGSGFLFAAYGLAVRKYMHGVNSVLAFAAICQYTAAALVVLMLCCGERQGRGALDLGGAQMTMLLLSAFIGIAVGHVFYYLSIARLGVAVTAGVLQLQPFLVAIGSMTLFGTHLASGQWMSGLVAVLGAGLMLYMHWRQSRLWARIEEPLAIAEGESGA